MAQKSLADSLLHKESNIWLTTIVVLLVMWFVISLFIFTGPGLSYNTSPASDANCYTFSQHNSGGTGADGGIRLGTTGHQTNEPCGSGAFVGGGARIKHYYRD
jgi:hypothetical protein